MCALSSEGFLRARGASGHADVALDKVLAAQA